MPPAAIGIQSRTIQCKTSSRLRGSTKDRGNHMYRKCMATAGQIEPPARIVNSVASRPRISASAKRGRVSSPAEGNSLPPWAATKSTRPPVAAHPRLCTARHSHAKAKARNRISSPRESGRAWTTVAHVVATLPSEPTTTQGPTISAVTPRDNHSATGLLQSRRPTLRQATRNDWFCLLASRLPSPKRRKGRTSARRRAATMVRLATDAESPPPTAGRRARELRAKKREMDTRSVVVVRRNSRSRLRPAT